MTLPSTNDRERRNHPFLRCSEPAVAEAALAQGASRRSAVNVLGALREWKNQFR